MIVLEVLGGVTLAILLLVSTWMAVVGLLGAVGVAMCRCRACGHLVLTSPDPDAPCPYCRHPWLANHLMPLRLHHYLPGEFRPRGNARLRGHLPEDDRFG